MKTYYQPLHYYNAGTEDEYSDIPDGLWDFQAFNTKEEADQWLINHGYDILQFDIHEYHDDDIEDVVIIDDEGNVIGNTSERIYGRLCDFLYRYQSDVPYNAPDLMIEAKDILDQIKYNWNELQPNK